MRTIVLLILGVAAFPCVCRSAPGGNAKVLDHFLRLSDVAAAAMMPEPVDWDHHKSTPGMRDYPMFFVDAYAVRALAAAYDLTGRERYYEACRTWSDRMLRHQEGMTPRGAYYMNYHRRPGEVKGQWFVADAGSIAMAVLATAARTKDAALRKRYIDSVRSYLRLTRDNYVRESGGITDGYFDKWEKEWWCSTALAGAAALQFVALTGEDEFRGMGLRAVDWLLRFEYWETRDLYKFEDGAPTTIFYILETYSSALPFLKAGSEQQRRVFRKFSETAEWIAYTQTRDGAWNYNPDNWGVKLGGFPCHLMIYLRDVKDAGARRRLCLAPPGVTVPFEQLVEISKARAMDHFASLAVNPRKFTQKEAFVLLSEAELLCPGEQYAKRKPAFPYRRYSEKELEGK